MSDNRDPAANDDGLDDGYRCGAYWLSRPLTALLLIVVGVVVWVLAGCGQPASTAPAVTTTVTIGGVGILPPTFATETADRSTSSVLVEQAAPVFDCATHINNLPYAVNDPEPAREAYRVTASCRGWDQATIDKWEAFIVDDVMQGESRWCPNVRGGAIMTGVGCGIARQGTKSDSGVMQLVRLWYEYPNGPLCAAEGLCSSEAIVGTPWASFNAGLFAVEFDGRGPWSYSDAARSYHPLWVTVTRYWP